MRTEKGKVVALAGVQEAHYKERSGVVNLVKTDLTDGGGDFVKRAENEFELILHTVQVLNRPGRQHCYCSCTGPENCRETDTSKAGLACLRFVNCY